jgi:hypothetical protein
MRIQKLVAVFLLTLSSLIISSCFGKIKKHIHIDGIRPQQVKINNSDLSGGVFTVTGDTGILYYIAYNGAIIFSSTNLDFTQPWFQYNLEGNVTGNIVSLAPYYANSQTAPQLILVTNAPAPQDRVYICSNIARNMYCSQDNISTLPLPLQNPHLTMVLGNNDTQGAIIESADNNSTEIYIANNTPPNPYQYNNIADGRSPKLIQNAIKIYDASMDLNGNSYFLVPGTINARTNLYKYQDTHGEGSTTWTTMANDDLISAPIAADYKGNVFYINEVGKEPYCVKDEWYFDIKYINNIKEQRDLMILSAPCSAPITIAGITVDSQDNIYMTISQNDIRKVYKARVQT